MRNLMTVLGLFMALYLLSLLWALFPPLAIVVVVLVGLGYAAERKALNK